MRRPLRPGRQAAGKKNHAISKWKQRFSARKAAHTARQADAERAISPFKGHPGSRFDRSTAYCKAVRKNGTRAAGHVPFIILTNAKRRFDIIYYILYFIIIPNYSGYSSKFTMDATSLVQLNLI